jgi:hypothetical protein
MKLHTFKVFWAATEEHTEAQVLDQGGHGGHKKTLGVGQGSHGEQGEGLGHAMPGFLGGSFGMQ